MPQTFLMVDFVIGDVTVYVYFCVLTFSCAITFFLRGCPNGPDVPAKMRTEHISAAITMVTDASLNHARQPKLNTQTKEKPYCMWCSSISVAPLTLGLRSTFQKHSCFWRTTADKKIDLYLFPAGEFESRSSSMFLRLKQVMGFNSCQDFQCVALIRLCLLISVFWNLTEAFIPSRLFSQERWRMRQ